MTNKNEPTPKSPLVAIFEELNSIMYNTGLVQPPPPPTFAQRAGELIQQVIFGVIYIPLFLIFALVAIVGAAVYMAITDAVDILRHRIYKD